MIRCLPQGLCSWNYTLEGDGRRAETSLQMFTEQGALAVEGVAFEIRKHGLASGHWTLEREGAVIISAQKSSVFTRTVELSNAEGGWTLRAESSFSRSFRIEREGATIAVIRPDHLFTRRATIELTGDQGDFTAVCFAFWLAVIAWRRAASRQS
jgi:hypothetical protein